MNIRRAQNKDIPKILELLSQVLEVHAAIRPDIFISGTTKYTESELQRIILDDTSPVFVATDENDTVTGYAMCIYKEQPKNDNMASFRSVYIDDLCVHRDHRGQGIGKKLAEHVKETARQNGCYEVTLNVWAGNDSAESFYLAMGFKPQKTVMEMIL